MKDLRKNAVWMAALALCLMASAAVGQVAKVDVGSNSVIWNPMTGDKMVLTVSGPAGDFRHEFAAGEKPALDVFDKNGALMQDGSYTWQLKTLPEIDSATRAAMRESRNDGTPFRGVLPTGATQSGTLTIQGGYFVLSSEEARNPVEAVVPNKDQVISDDLIVQGSICTGQDCVNGESFGFDTLRLKENNLRIKFQDTSNSASFPTNDWQLTANSSDNGGANKFSIDDIDGGRTPFTIEASAPSNSLYVDDGGRVGLGTATPVVELHIVNGDSPTVRLEQDGSSGFTPQTWDMAGNETNWFVRDATNGSRLPFKIRPSAPTNSIFVDTDGEIGFGTASPVASLHVLRADDSPGLLIDNNLASAPTQHMINVDSAATSGVVSMMNFETQGARPRFTMTHGGVSRTWNFDILNTSGHFAVVLGGSAGAIDFNFETDGDLDIPGNFISNGMTLMVPDFVFDDDYDLMPLDEVKSFIEAESHLPNVPSAEMVKEQGLNITDMQLKLLQKVEELTLYTLDQHDTIRGLQDTVQQLKDELAEIQSAQQ